MLKFKKILAGALATAMVVSSAATVAFADKLSEITTYEDYFDLKVKTAGEGAAAESADAVRGQQVEVSVDLTKKLSEDVEQPIGAIGVRIAYDKSAFKYVSCSSDYIKSGIINNEKELNGKQYAVFTGSDLNTKNANTGHILTAVFEVLGSAGGGAKTFTLAGNANGDNSAFVVGDADGIKLTDSLKDEELDTCTVNVQAPETLVLEKPVIGDTAEGVTKVTWTKVDNATGYTMDVFRKVGEQYTKLNQSPISISKDLTEYDISRYITVTGTYQVQMQALGTGYLYYDSEVVASDDKSLKVASYIEDDSMAYVTPPEKGVDITFVPNGNTVTSVVLNSDPALTVDTDYKASGNILHINHDKIMTAAATSDNAVKVTVTFSDGSSDTITINVTNAADAATLVFAEQKREQYTKDVDDDVNDGTKEGLIVVTGTETLPLVNFLSVSFSVTNQNDPGKSKIDYEIMPADGYAMEYDEATGLYNINVKPLEGASPTESEKNNGEGIVIGKLVYPGGYGKGEITPGNITVTTETADNLYHTLTGIPQSFKYEVNEPTSKIHVDVTYNLPTEVNNSVDYEQMKLQLYSARLGYIDIPLGHYEEGSNTVEVGGTNVKATIADNSTEGTEPHKYTVDIEELPAFEKYTLSIKGDGYRTAKVSLELNDEKTVHFWNNAMDSDNNVYVETTNTGEIDSRASKNFLAGDIVMDGTIDLYDLSGVSSYFGKGMSTDPTSPEGKLTETDDHYIKYDLNRDHQVDIRDITMVLAGWAE